MKIVEVDDKLIGLDYTSVGDVRLVHDSHFQWLPNNSVDLILTDPPFNIARDTNFHTFEGNTINSYRFDANKGWDSYTSEVFKQLLIEWSAEFFRVLRPGGNFAIFCADEYISDLIAALKVAGLKPRRTLTWRKPNAVPINRKHMMMSACEYIVLGVKGSKSVFNANIDTLKSPFFTDQEIVAISDKAATVTEQEIRKALKSSNRRLTPQEVSSLVATTITRNADAIAKRSINIYSQDGTSAELCVPNFVTFNSKSGGRLHPTEKPVTLLRYLTELFSKPGDLVLDPFAGSSSMGETAILSGRQAVLVEQDLEFYLKGSTRIRSISEEVDLTLFN